jgi:4'-phosphopantetheinyl transferase
MWIAAVPMTRWFPRRQLERFLGKIDPSRAERLRRYRRDEDFQRSLFGYLLVNHLVRRSAPWMKEVPTVGTNEFGKPYLQDYRDLHFNLSHSGSWVACVLSSAPVGIDVEQIQSGWQEIARNVFAPSEMEDFLAMPVAQGEGYFFDVWTLKESYLKMTGEGLSHPLTGIAVGRTGTGELRILHDDRAVADVFPAVSGRLQGYRLALCAQIRPTLESLEFIAMDRLLQSSLVTSVHPFRDGRKRHASL